LAVHTNDKKWVKIGFYSPWPNIAILEQRKFGGLCRRNGMAAIPKNYYIQNVCQNTTIVMK
jgi:hypothetical protein